MRNLLFAALALTVGAQQFPTTIQNFEVDVVFPRNESYAPKDVFPIVLAIQNISILRAIGDFEAYWDIMPFSEGYIPGRITYDGGSFQIPNDTATDGPTFLVTTTNGTNRVPVAHCRGIIHNGFSASPQEDPFGNTILESLDIPECPALGAVVEIRPNATMPECPRVELLEGREGNPCAVKVDQAVTSSISSRATSMASATLTTSTTSSPSSSSTAGVGPARTVQTALAAACIIGSLAL
ncbi:hypothetical protein C8A00DRAFT_36353 [Chaetomidium leptoderma]|uniref:DUF7136 domain-containing protein n=1 Tax=Chaetomidium leptoderma TaxID=669021 RepID=A0AAN6VGD2_9PEZI|nr:hypothetical protein C8A00DRAFT_36353 [Chaetomidium leptoderma]